MSSRETILNEAYIVSDARDAILAALEPLSKERAQFLLAQILAEFSKRDESSAPPIEPNDKNKKWIVRGKAKIGRPRKRAHGEKSAILLGLLKEHPHTPIAEIAEKVYGGSNTEAQNRARSLLAGLKRRGKVTNVGSGEWEVIPKS